MRNLKLIGKSQISGNNDIGYRNYHQYSNPVWFVSGYRDIHPDKYADYNIYQGYEYKNNPPHRPFGNLQHKNHIKNRDPGEPSVGSVGFGRGGVWRKKGNAEREPLTGAFRSA